MAESAAAMPVKRREIFAWAMYDFANSGYTTVVLTTVFNAYFVAVVAAGQAKGTATLLWTVATAIANVLVLLSAPVLGAIADHRASKKRFLMISTIGCVIFTALLGVVGPGDIVLGITFVVLSYFMFATGENFIASFLPELAEQKNIARLSGYGWSLGYMGGASVLALCLVYVQAAQGRGESAADYVPVTMWITAAVFAFAAIITFLGLRERAIPQSVRHASTVLVGFARVRQTLSHARHYRDLFRFLIALSVYYCGINTVIALAAIYAQEVMGFGTRENIILILLLNFTAAIGAFSFGLFQDRIGSVRTLALVLGLWIIALSITYLIQSPAGFWFSANLVGLALGSSQSAGRALVGLFSPKERTAEFFGLWGLFGKFAAVIGPLTYGAVTYATGGDHRLALLVTVGYFVVGLAILLTVDEQRGRAAARTAP